MILWDACVALIHIVSFPCCFATQTVKGGLSENQRDVDVLLVWASSLHRDQANICITPVLVCVADMEIPQA